MAQLGRALCFEPEAHPVGDEARVRREKIRSIGHGSVIDDYIFDRTRTQKLRFLKNCISKLNIEVWLSLVERYVRDVEVASSNLVTSTIKSKKRGIASLF